MKKQIKPVSPFSGKLSLNKRTISNLNTSEMNKPVGGAPTQGNCAPTVKGRTCGYHRGQYTCQCS